MARRVAMGGHGIPENDIRRRFERSRANFLTLYIPLADEFTVLDNSRDDIARIVAQGGTYGISVIEPDLWKTFNHPQTKREPS